MREREGVGKEAIDRAARQPTAVSREAGEGVGAPRRERVAWGRGRMAASQSWEVRTRWVERPRS